MTKIILKEWEHRDEKNNLIATSSIQVCSEDILEMTKKETERAAKKAKLKSHGYTDEDLVKIEAEMKM